MKVLITSRLKTAAKKGVDLTTIPTGQQKVVNKRNNNSKSCKPTTKSTLAKFVFTTLNTKLQFYQTKNFYFVDSKMSAGHHEKNEPFHRLSLDVKPSHYKLNLNVEVEKFEFQ